MTCRKKKKEKVRVLRERRENLSDCKEIQPVHPKGNQSWIFSGRTDAEAETPEYWPPDAKNWLIGKDPDAGKDWRQEEKCVLEEMWQGWPLTKSLWEQNCLCTPECMVCCYCLVAMLCPTLAPPWAIARQAPLCIRFPRQEYWSGLPGPSPGDLPDPGI